MAMGEVRGRDHNDGQSRARLPANGCRQTAAGKRLPANGCRQTAAGKRLPRRRWVRYIASEGESRPGTAKTKTWDGAGSQDLAEN